jgi:dsRNA-specific ribonuclease
VLYNYNLLLTIYVHIEARIRVRQEFESKRQLDDPETVKKQLRTAQQVAHILKHNIVQAHLRPNDKVFEVKLDASRHELGENDSRFSKKSSTPAAVGKCCGSA